MFCTACGKPLCKEDVRYCSHCGATLSGSVNVESEPHPFLAVGAETDLPDGALIRPPAEIDVYCTSCGSRSEVHKASAIWENGTMELRGRFSGTGMGVGFGFDGPALIVGGGGGRIGGTQQTYLASKLSPPHRPAGMGLGELLLLLIIGGIVFGLSFALTYGSLEDAGLHVSRYSDYFVLLSLIPTIFALAPVYRYLHRSQERSTARYREQFEYWNHLWYCFRCGNTSYLTK